MASTIGGKRQANFTVEKDVRVAQCVLTVSQDAIKASNQSSDQFGSRIEESFNVAHTPERTKKSLQNKWTEIKHD